MISLLDLPHVEARRLARSGAPVWLSVNPVEYHGPHLSLHNDRLVSAGLIRELHARVCPDAPLLVASDLEAGVEPCAGIGTRYAAYRTVRALVVEACRALAELGAERVVLMTFHGAPLHNLALQAGVRELQRRGVRALAPFHLVLREQLDIDPQRFAAAVAHASAEDREALLEGLQFDFHAGFFETSMALLYAPDSVSPSHADLPPCPPVTGDRMFAAAGRLARAVGASTLAAELAFASVGTGWSTLRPFPGYTGRPHLATAAAGRVFADVILDLYEPATRAVLERGEAPPEPIFPWVASATLDGRLFGLPRIAPGDIWAAS